MVTVKSGATCLSCPLVFSFFLRTFNTLIKICFFSILWKNKVPLWRSSCPSILAIFTYPFIKCNEQQVMHSKFLSLGLPSINCLVNQCNAINSGPLDLELDSFQKVVPSLNCSSPKLFSPKETM